MLRGDSWVRIRKHSELLMTWLVFLCCVAAGVFGQHLEETMMYEAQCVPQRLVPVLVEQCVCFIREHGLEEEGLFRAPGQTNHVRELQDAFDRGEKPVFDRWCSGRGHCIYSVPSYNLCWIVLFIATLFFYSTTDVHTVASLLKLYIRELPEPIIPFSKYTQFLSCAQLLTKDKAMVITCLLNTLLVYFQTLVLAINMSYFCSRVS